MRRTYQLELHRLENGWFRARSEEFGLELDASSPTQAVTHMRTAMERDGVNRMIALQPIPAPDTKEIEDGIQYAFVDTDIEHEYEKVNPKSVKRTISLPAWMDCAIRVSGVDASKLFQNAAAKYLEQTESPPCTIDSVDKLKEMVPKDILDQYLNETIVEKFSR
ncbi:MAG: hypothetical protein LUE86_06915 [Clostridiales bacterium]|nr:hypothetical protein [Clostridiales bacterium]